VPVPNLQGAENVTKRLELYEWSTDSRKNAENMYSVARSFLLKARRYREAARKAKDVEGRSFLKGEAYAFRGAASMILGYVRQGRDHDDWYHRKIVREVVHGFLKKQQPTNLVAAACYDEMLFKGAGLDRPEFDSTKVLE
jgi:hypothetical protein